MIELQGYTIDGNIHKGTSSIYRGKRDKDALPVVIKCLNDRYSTPESLSKIDFEFSIMSRLNHKGIVKVYTKEFFKNGSAIIMEDFGAVSLKELLISTKFSIKTYLEKAIQLVKIIAYIHQNRIVHKNINPSNILINPKNKDLKIIDFAIASVISSEQAISSIPNDLEGNPAYISPEQTGRMNSNIDYRSDFYSLGITFYEMLTGELPFKGRDAVEMVHCHIAKEIETPEHKFKETPMVLWEIIKKLTEKDKENRYQSISAIQSDLETCLNQLLQNNSIKNFSIGLNDSSRHFKIPQKLYGREEEIIKLEQGFKSCTNGNEELCLVSGYSGIGKTVLINEIQRHVSTQRGYFISGKFQQFQQDGLYFAIIQALTDLMKHLLSESNERLENWKQAILNAVGINGRLITNIIPELEQIIGSQPQVRELTGQEAQNRFMITFQNFVLVFARKEHPLVMFLDDMQWADRATLRMIEIMVSYKKIPYFYFIGAFRDNEVQKGHPLLLTIEEINKNKAATFIHLTPLTEKSIDRMLCDTLLRNPQEVKALSSILKSKTNGNPFFLKKLLTSLHANNLIWLDPTKKQWEFNCDKIQRESVSENVVEYLLDRLKKFPEDSRKILNIASCIKNHFNLNTIMGLTKISPDRVKQLLKKAVEEEIIMPMDHQYRLAFEAPPKESSRVNPAFCFLHDRIQQAAYELSDETTRKNTHLTHGRLLWKKLDLSKGMDYLSDLLYHLNEGVDLMVDGNERYELSKLNLKAGISARKAAAYIEALNYLQTGLELLPKDPWNKAYDLILPLSMEYSECAYFSGNHEKGKQQILLTLKHVRSDLEKAKAIKILVTQYSTLGKMEESIELGLDGLRHLGVNISQNPKESVILEELMQIKSNQGSRKISELEDAPEIKDPNILAIFDLIMEIMPSAYLIGNKNLFMILTLTVVNLSLRHGNSSVTAFAFVTYGILLCSALDNPREGYQFGKLSMALSDRYQDPRVDCRIYHLYVDLIFHWANHWSKMEKIQKEGIKIGYQSGNLLYIAYLAHHRHTWDPRLTLKELITEKKKDRAIIKETGYQDALNETNLVMHLYLNFQGKTIDKYSFNTKTFDESQCLREMQKSHFITGITAYHIWKAEMFAFYGDYDRAVEHVTKAKPTMGSVMALPYEVRFCVVTFLSHGGRYTALNPQDKKTAWKQMQECHGKMKTWANFTPDNFVHLQLMMEAELAKLSGEHIKALKLYNKAIQKAHDHFWLRDEAVINELAGRLYLEFNDEKAAAGYLYDAYHLYYIWGAERKMADMAQKHPNIFERQKAIKKMGPVGKENFSKTQKGHSSEMPKENPSSATCDDPAKFGYLDIETLLKSTRAISKEIVLETLIKNMMKIVIENAGAQKGYFIVPKENNELIILANVSFAGEAVAMDMEHPVQGSGKLPEGLIHYVARTHEQVVLFNRDQSVFFQNDEYFNTHHIKSVLCLPLIGRKQLQGILYLENNLTPGAFSPDRVEVLKILTSQIIISLENARLYRSLENQKQILEQQVAERTKELEELAMTDPLTKLMNRRSMNEKLNYEKIRYQRSRKPFSILLGDIDNFKYFNDTYGHDFGDAVLQTISKVMKSSLRKQDLICRWGGEEFLIVLPETEFNGAMLLAERLRKNIFTTTLYFNNQPVNISMTFGLSIYNSLQSVENTIKKADDGLYEGKKNGKNRVVFIQ
ncbi:diguanylate cyclase (GGDEF) domain-containing protein [Desulfocicer vacuolatum DSM 3385]|uniref:Diguanylate cyclase (GGDEF) domain-containing protein n=1 Tax=Desulfocicer vacuolatum DSM 3385 TaxID=1121400 RepID=A0A1W2AQK8_9BACT|nr:diguanylate cyclase [Desulfocicer vacuolatum]SMC62965.1 diguanylate cyclase (GGDEF) domain-containing protein [Desulfocicer vacuolatum DSM 3385]